MAVRLSKSRYVAGLQCPKRLYLEIHEGMMASLQFHRMAFGDGDSAEKETIRTALLTYCARDTLAMVAPGQGARLAPNVVLHRMENTSVRSVPRERLSRTPVFLALVLNRKERYHWRYARSVVH